MSSRDESFDFIVDSANLSDMGDARELNDDLNEEDLDQVYSDELEPEEYGGNRDGFLADLASSRPLYLIQRSHQQSAILPQVFNDIAIAYSNEMSFGIVAPMPRMSPTTLRNFFQAHPAAQIRIADPECFARPDSLGPVLEAQREKAYVGQSTRRHWTYFDATQPPGGTAQWVQQVIDTQVNVGASVFLTPGVWADPAASRAGMNTMRQHAAWARGYLGAGTPLMVNVTLSWPWLTTERLREQFLNEVLDMDEEVFYVRVRWPLLGQPYGQLLDAGILDGYVEMANIFEENDKSLILPNTGLTGAVALAWGAHGFSTGLGSGERSFADTRVIKIKQSRPRPAPTRRILAAQILHTTDLTTSGLLDAVTGGQRCACAFCNRLRARPVGQFDKALAGAHYLRRVADFAAALASGRGGRRATARQLVRTANQFATSASSSVALSGANDPKHLPLWLDRLR